MSAKDTFRQWDLHSENGNTSLVMRYATKDGADYQGCPAAWKTVATFGSRSDAETVLVAIRKGEASRD